MIRGLDLNQLRVLEILLETGSVKQTAAHIGASPASVSRSLKALRAMFGDPLLVKTKDGMVRTKRADIVAQALPEWIEATETLALLAREAPAVALESEACRDE